MNEVIASLSARIYRPWRDGLEHLEDAVLRVREVGALRWDAVLRVRAECCLVGHRAGQILRPSSPALGVASTLWSFGHLTCRVEQAPVSVHIRKDGLQRPCSECRTGSASS